MEEGDERERERLRETLKELWQEAWEHGTYHDKMEALRFVSQSLVDRAEEVICEALDSDEPDVRDMGAEAAARFGQRVQTPPSLQFIDALWSYLLNAGNRRRVLAWLTLERLGRLRDARLMSLVRDPDERIRQEARRLLALK